MRYGIISSSRDINAGYMDLDMLEYSLRDKDYTLVSMNTSKNTIRWRDQGGNHVLSIEETATKEKGGVWKATNMLIPLFEKLACMISAGNTVMFTDVTQVTSNPDEMFYVYKYFVERGIQLEFLYSPWLDSSNYYVTALKNPSEVNRIVDRVIMSTYKSSKDPATLFSVDASESHEVLKKNREDDN